MRWSCYYCGDDVIEGQRFGYLPGKGFLHMECLYEAISKKFPDGIPKEVLAALELEELAGYTIIRVKQLEAMLSGEEKEGFTRIRKRFEGISAESGKILHSLLERYGVEIEGFEGD